VLGAVFAARAGSGDVAHGVEGVFAVAAVLAGLALLAVLALVEVPLERKGGRTPAGANLRERARAATGSAS
jgi:hypothetical protein